MAKSDKRRAQGKLDEQQKLSQGYLTGLQGQLAGQYGGLSNAYFGGVPSPTANTFGWGTTTPQFSWTGQSYFPGSTTGNNVPFGAQAVPRTGGGIGERTNPYYQSPAPPPGGNMPGTGNVGAGGNYTADQVRAQLMPLLQQSGPASSQTLERLLPQIQQMFPGARRDTSQGPLDEIVVPGVGVVDLIGNAEGAGPKNWQFNVGPGGGFGGGGGILGQTMNDYGNIMRQYQNWADTGGLSEQDKANLRTRSLSPIRSVYAQGLQNLQRQRALQGGYSPGMTTALGRFNREQGQLTSDAAANAEAAITDMMLRGKQFGMQGMSGLYGQTPGLAGTIGNQMLASMGQQLQAGGLQNQLASLLTGGTGDLAKIPGFDWGGLLQGLGYLGMGIGAL